MSTNVTLKQLCFIQSFFSVYTVSITYMSYYTFFYFSSNVLRLLITDSYKRYKSIIMHRHILTIFFTKLRLF